MRLDVWQGDPWDVLLPLYHMVFGGGNFSSFCTSVEVEQLGDVEVIGLGVKEDDSMELLVQAEGELRLEALTSSKAALLCCTGRSDLDDRDDEDTFEWEMNVVLEFDAGSRPVLLPLL